MYFKRVYQQSRILFFVILLAVFGQLFFMWKGVENIPFFLYHMFGFAHERKSSYPVLMIRYGNTTLSPYSLSNRDAELIFNTMDRYLRLKKEGDYLQPLVDKRFQASWLSSWHGLAERRLINDAVDIAAFPRWWTDRLRARVPAAMNQEITVWRGEARYHPTYRLQLDAEPQLRIPVQQP